MPTGRRPKPTQLRAIEGNRGHASKAKLAKREREPEPADGIGRMPKGLTGRAARKWREFVRGWSTVPGLLTAIDNGALEATCRAYGQAVKADLEIDKLQRLISSGKSTKDDVYRLSIINAVSKKSWQQYGKFSLELGGSPASRVRLQGAGEDGPATSASKSKISKLEAALCG